MVGYTIMFTLVLFTILQLTLTILLTDTTDWLDIVNVVPNLGVCVMTVIKYTKLHTHKELYDDIFYHFHEQMWDIVSPYSKRHKRIVATYGRVSHIINRFLLYYSIPLIVVVDSFPYLVMIYEEKFLDEKEYLYPFDGWYPFDKVKFYAAAYIWESCMTAVVVSVYMFSNMIHASIITFICMELRILGECLEDLISPQDVSNIRRGVDAVNLEVFGRLKSIIVMHEFLAKKSAALDSVLGVAMLLNYSLGAIFICLTAFTA
ncbi:unnamed protein product, partial [Leptidea sinapis]